MPDQTPEVPTETNDSTDEVAEGATPDETEVLDDPGKRALDAERKARKTAEREAKKAATELAELQKQSMSDQERAVEEAKEAGRSEVRAEMATERVADAVRIAATGRNVDVEALLEGLDRSRFVSDDGPDREAIQQWVDRVAPAQEPTPHQIDLGQGVRSRDVPLNGDGIEEALRKAVGF